MPSYDPRATLEHLRDEDLFGVATNTSAIHRDLAIQLLVERCSPLALRDEIAEQARKYVLDNPLVLTKINPAATVTSIKMPGVIECIADAQLKRQALAKLVSENDATHTKAHAELDERVEQNHTSQALALADARLELATLVAAYHASHVQQTDDLEIVIADNKAAGATALREAGALIWHYVLKQA